MSRLVQPIPKPGPILAADTKKSTGYPERLVKYIPGEIITGYLFVLGVMNTIDSSTEILWAHIITFSIFLILVPVYYIIIAKKDEPKRKQIIISTLAFIIWIYNIDQLPHLLNIYKPWVAALLMTIIVILSYLIVPEEGEK
jgi:hypothetical protein